VEVHKVMVVQSSLVQWSCAVAEVVQLVPVETQHLLRYSHRIAIEKVVSLMVELASQDSKAADLGVNGRRPSAQDCGEPDRRGMVG